MLLGVQLPQVDAARSSVQDKGVAAAEALVASRPSKLRTGSKDWFVQGAAVVSQDHAYVSYGRTYEGLPVVGGDFVVVTDKSGNVVHTSVAQDTPVENVPTTATVTDELAEHIARGLLASVSETVDARLVVYTVDGPARLAWETTVAGTAREGGPSKRQVHVDALTGAVLDSQELVAHGTGNSAWTGPVRIDTTKADIGYSMIDPNIKNFSCGNYNKGNGKVLTKWVDRWGNGSRKNLESACSDVLFAGQVENRMLAEWLGRSGPDGNGGAWPVWVGIDEENAYYTGREIQIGHNKAGEWITSLDILAHEMGHGIDYATPGGRSRNGTSEFIADVFGTATEFYAGVARYNEPDYEIGEQINLHGNGPIRYMYDPAKVSGHPNCYGPGIPSWTAHADAGVGNHWYYLLAEGSNPVNGQPTSPTCDNSTLTGIGIKDATKILYNAMLMKTTASGYPSYRTWTIQAAKNLGNPAHCEVVKAAWTAVSVPAEAGEPAC
ncbi:M4 family peptidase [Pseudonocardiaceae bacterium YIM PH 21723]|nr:M4 family peptidase [Pseudonocardiaceae bacterium YIM PH 21723]